MALDLTAFGIAIARLQEAMTAHAQNPSDTFIRDALIHRSEFTYELAHKMLKRALEAAAPSPDAFDRMPFADLIRSGNEQGFLLGDWSGWKRYREMRGRTSHTYDEAVALDVVAGIGDFLREAVHLRRQLQSRAG